MVAGIVKKGTQITARVSGTETSIKFFNGPLTGDGRWYELISTDGVQRMPAGTKKKTPLYFWASNTNNSFLTRVVSANEVAPPAQQSNYSGGKVSLRVVYKNGLNLFNSDGLRDDPHRNTHAFTNMPRGTQFDAVRQDRQASTRFRQQVVYGYWYQITKLSTTENRHLMTQDKLKCRWNGDDFYYSLDDFIGKYFFRASENSNEYVKEVPIVQQTQLEVYNGMHEISWRYAFQYGKFAPFPFPNTNYSQGNSPHRYQVTLLPDGTIENKKILGAEKPKYTDGMISYVYPQKTPSNLSSLTSLGIM